MADYVGGYTGVVLRVNLTTKEVLRQKLDLDLTSKFVGGRGLNLKYLYDEVDPNIDPLGPDNKIIVGVGPCNGTLVPGSQRFTITSKSPLTGFIGDSNSGGDFGAELKYAGYDMIIIEGQSEMPVYLWINDENVQLREAGHLWGKTTSETRRTIEREVNYPEACVISIGPAGENLVKFGNLITELGRASGRAGMGAVFGSKKLKAVAVSGTRGVKVADYKMLKEACKQNLEAWRGDVAAYQMWAKYGPVSATTRYDARGMWSVRNFQGGVFTHSIFEDILRYFTRQKACISCPLGCNHSFIIKEGPYAGIYGEGIEQSQIGDLGPRVGNDDVALSLRASALCDEYGIDLFDIAATIAYAMECYENGILTEGDVNGLKLQWGNAQAILSLIEMTTYRRGIGDVFSQGLKRASEIIGKGSEKYAMHAKNQSLVMRDPRASKGWALMYAVASRGACHMRAAMPEGHPDISAWDVSIKKLIEKYLDPTNPLLEEGKPEITKWYEDLRAFQNCMEICIFAPYGSNQSLPELMAKFYNSVTGNNINGDDVLLIGERIINLERLFNIRAGLTRSDDSLPDRMLKEPLPDGPAKGEVVKLEPMLDQYYELRGWDRDSGIPSKKKLLELGLPDV